MEVKAVNNFNGGEVSPYLYGRDDIPKLYNKSCLTMENFIPLPYGGATKRPGTKSLFYVNGVVDENNIVRNEEVRILPFEFSSDESYLLVFSNQQINVIKNDTVIYEPGVSINDSSFAWHQSMSSLTENPENSAFFYCTTSGGTDAGLGDETTILVDGDYVNVSTGDELQGESPCFFIKNPSEIEPAEQTADKPNANTIYLKASFFPIDPDNQETGFVQKTSDQLLKLASPYRASQLKDIKFVQSADVVFLVHPNYPPKKLSRISDTNWTFTDFDYIFPPLNNEEDSGLTISSSSSTGSTTLTSNIPFFNRNMEGEFLAFSVPRTLSQASLSTPSGGLNQSNISDSLNVSNTNWTITTGGNWLGRVAVERSLDGGLNFVPYLTIVDTFNQDFSARENKAFTTTEPEGNDTLVRVRYDFYDDTGVEYLTYVLSPEDPNIISLVRITRFIDENQAEAEILSPFQNSLQDYLNWTQGNGYAVGDLVFNQGGVTEAADATYDLSDASSTLTSRPVQMGYETTSSSTIIGNFDKVEGMDYGGPGGTLLQQLGTGTNFSWTAHSTSGNAYQLQAAVSVGNTENRPYINYPTKVFKNGNTLLTEVSDIATVDSTPNSWCYDIADASSVSNDHYTLYVNGNPSGFTSLHIEVPNQFLYLVSSELDYTASTVDQFVKIHHNRRPSDGKDFFMLLATHTSTDADIYFKDICCNGSKVATLEAYKFYVTKSATYNKSHSRTFNANQIVCRVREWDAGTWNEGFTYSDRQYYTARQDETYYHEWINGCTLEKDRYNAGANDTPRSIAHGNGRYIINMVRDRQTTGMNYPYSSTFTNTQDVGTYALHISDTFSHQSTVSIRTMRDVISKITTTAFRTGATFFENEFYFLNTVTSKVLERATSIGTVTNTTDLSSLTNPTYPTGIALINNKTDGGTQDFNNKQLMIIDSDTTAGNGGKLYLQNYRGIKRYYEATEDIADGSSDDFNTQFDAGKWKESVGDMNNISRGAFSADQGYPSAITLFENRLVLGGSLRNPGTIYLSATDNYLDFKTSTLATASMRLTINSGKLDVIEWFMPHQDLIIGCSGSEWTLGSDSDSVAISPTQFSLKRRTTYGTSTLPAVLVNSAVLFYMRNKRKLRQWTFNYEAQDYAAEDLSIIAEHITKGGIDAVAYQQSPDTILWSVRNDGELIGMTYERDQSVIGWHRHKLNAYKQQFQVLGNYSFSRNITDTTYQNWAVDNASPSTNTITMTGNNKCTWNYSGDGNILALVQEKDQDLQNILKTDETYICECYVSKRYSDNEAQFAHVNAKTTDNVTRLPLKPGLNRVEFVARGPSFVIKRPQNESEDSTQYVNQKLHVDMDYIRVVNKKRYQQTSNAAFKDVACVQSENNEDILYAVQNTDVLSFATIDDTKILNENNLTETIDNRTDILRFYPRDYNEDLNNYVGMDLACSFTSTTDSLESYKDLYKYAVGFDITVTVDGKTLEYNKYLVVNRNASNVEVPTEQTNLFSDDQYIILNSGTVDTTNGSKIVVGVKYTGIVAPIYFNSPKINNKGLKINAPFANIQFKDTVKAKAGQTLNKKDYAYTDLEEVKFATKDDNLKNGFAEVYMKSASEYLETINIVADDTTPVEVTSMLVKVTEGDV